MGKENKVNITDEVLKIVNQEVPSGTTIVVDTVVLNASAIDDNTSREIVMRVEETFDVEIPDKDAEKLHTVKDIVEYVTEATKKSGTE